MLQKQGPHIGDSNGCFLTLQISPISILTISDNITHINVQMIRLSAFKEVFLSICKTPILRKAFVLASFTAMGFASSFGMAYAAPTLAFASSADVNSHRWDYTYDHYTNQWSIIEQTASDQDRYNSSCGTSDCTTAGKIALVDGVSAKSRSQVDGTTLRARSWASAYVDSANFEVQKVQAVAHADWTDQWLIAPTADHAAGSFGRIKIRLQLDGSFPDTSLNPGPIGDDPVDGGVRAGDIKLSATSSFDDTFGAHHSSRLDVTPTWTTLSGTATAETYLLFQYGTAFSFNLSMDAQSLSWSPHGSSGTPFIIPDETDANFLDGGRIAQILVPDGTTLQTGASLVGQASYANSIIGSTDPNLYVASVPEPETYALMLAGMGMVAFMRRRQRVAGQT